MNLRNLLTVKSLVTLLLTVTFVIVTIADFLMNGVLNNLFVTVYPICIGFYFGNQSLKQNQETNQTQTVQKSKQSDISI